jgi:hypothetical protein
MSRDGFSLMAMETLLNDIFTAKPDALLMIAGLAFIGVAVVGSIKTYIDPGKAGRIAAGAVGGILLIAGLAMYKAAPAPPSTSTDEAVASTKQSTGAGTSGQSSGSATSVCYAPGHWPADIQKNMAVGDACTLNSGLPGRAVQASPMCTYTSGPLTGTTQHLNVLMYLGYNCSSPDHKSKGTVLPPAHGF